MEVEDKNNIINGDFNQVVYRDDLGCVSIEEASNSLRYSVCLSAIVNNYLVDKEGFSKVQREKAQNGSLVYDSKESFGASNGEEINYDFSISNTFL